MAVKEKNIWILMIFILSGLVVGGLLGDLAGKDEVAETHLACEFASNINAAATKTYTDTELAKKATTTSVTTLETNLTTAISGKAAIADSLAGYGIKDAYTKTEVDGMFA